jgi:hypothetical protein
MRHFRVVALAIPPLALRVTAPPLAAGLVPPTGGEQARAPRRPTAALAAVAVAAIAVSAEKEDLAARGTCAGHESQ